MNKVERLKSLAGYEQDFARWSAEQAALLREGRLDFVDLENVAEEIESLGRSEKSEIEHRLGVLLVHLLKWQFQPSKRTGSWRSTIREQRTRIARRIKDSPSLKGYPAEIFAEEYVMARMNASDETGLAQTIFPLTCPLSIEQVLAADYFPDN
jgi:hypothetical protein